jgi:small conductance mechanosensitive channel
MLKAVRPLPGVLATPPPEAYLKDLGPSSVQVELHCYCASADYGAVRERMISASKLALEVARIGIPYPQLALHIEGQELPLRSAKPIPLPRPSQPA